MIKTKKYWVLTMVVVFSLILVACSAEEARPAVKVEQLVEVAEANPGETAVEEAAPEGLPEPAEEVVEEVEPVVAPIDENEVDTLFASFLSSMVKQNTIVLDSLN